MSRSGNRHLRPDSRVRLGDPIAGSREVAVVAHHLAASSYAGQATLALLVDLLARQFGVVGRVWIDVPDVPVQPAPYPRTKPAATDRLVDALLEVGHSAGGDEVQVSAGRPAKPSVVVATGTSAPPTAGELVTIFALGNGMQATCASDADRLVAQPGDSPLPFGPQMAACLAADRVFRALRGADVRGALKLDLSALGDPVPAEFAASTPLGMALPPAYLVGLGAVGAAALFCLASAPTIESAFVGIDPESASDSNRNRLLTAGYLDAGRSKASLAAALAAGTKVEFWPNELFWAEYQSAPDRQVPAPLKAAEPVRYEWILSAVDKNVSRHDVAKVMPRHVLSGSTDGLVAQATYYSMVGNCECLACNHPVPSLDRAELTARLGAMTAAERRGWFEERDVSQAERAAIEDYLRDPSCGQAGAAALRQLGLSEVDWAVGFVSVAAGVMLAARFAQLAADRSPFVPTQYPEQRLFFLGAGSVDQALAVRKRSCPLCSSAPAQASFAARWRGSEGGPQR